MKWIYNKYVTLGLTFPEVSDESAVKHWDVKQRQHIDVGDPDIVCSCNQSLGGVDLAYMLRAFYHGTLSASDGTEKLFFSLQANWYHKKTRTDTFGFHQPILWELVTDGRSSSSNKMGCLKHSSTPSNTAAEWPTSAAHALVIAVWYDVTYHLSQYGKKIHCWHCFRGCSRIYWKLKKVQILPVFEQEPQLFESVASEITVQSEINLLCFVIKKCAGNMQ